MKTSFPRNKIKFLLLEGVSNTAVEALEKAGYANIEYVKSALNTAELIEKVQGVHFLGIRSKTKIEAEVFEKADKLMAVGCFCIGTNQVDLLAATKKGVVVFNSPFSNTRSVAELVIAEIIALMRRLTERSHAAHQGEWLKDANQSFEVRGKTLGIIGYGHIGSQVSVMAEALGMKVIYHDIEPKLPLGNAEPETFKNLIKSSDVVSLHVPGTADTKGMIGAKEIAQMKKGAILLNLSRGDVIDIEALKDAILSHHLLGVGVDVYPQEPKSKGEKFISPLQGLDNVILTPHIGGSTQEAQENIGVDIAYKFIEFIEAGKSVGSHSIPALNLPSMGSKHRILHIHKNEPGMLAALNNIISAMDINVTGQYLATNAEVGYVVTDLESNGKSKNLEEKLREVPHTIRTRVLY